MERGEVGKKIGMIVENGGELVHVGNEIMRE